MATEGSTRVVVTALAANLAVGVSKSWRPRLPGRRRCPAEGVHSVADSANQVLLHDLIGHATSVMLVLTAAARVVLDHDPDKARELLAGAERTGRRRTSEPRCPLASADRM